MRLTGAVPRNRLYLSFRGCWRIFCIKRRAAKDASRNASRSEALRDSSLLFNSMSFCAFTAKQMLLFLLTANSSAIIPKYVQEIVRITSHIVNI